MISYIILLGIFEYEYERIRIEATKNAEEELNQHKYTLYDVADILKEGYECGSSKRKYNVIEKCLKKGKKEVKAVVAKVERKYPEGGGEELWILIHFGVNTYKKERRSK